MNSHKCLGRRVRQTTLVAACFLGLPAVSFAQCQLQKIYAIEGDPCEQFGKAVDIDGDRIVVGAHSADDDPAVPCATGWTGAAYVFDRVGSGWILTQRLLASDGGPDDEFGNNVGISGDRIIVGAEYHDGPGQNSGAAYIYELQGSLWVEVAELEAPDAHALHYFARSVAIAGDLAVCGTRFDEVYGYQSGAFYIFERDVDGNWVWKAKQAASDGAENDLFGNAIATDGNRIVVGAYWKDGASGEKAGAAYVFEKFGPTWRETAKLEASDAAANAEFGRSVAVDGDRILVGAVRDQGSGSAYVYELEGEAWVETAKLVPSDGVFNDRFGESCDLEGGNAVVGARHANDPTFSGSVYLFQEQEGTWTETARLKPLDVETGNAFGYDSALSGDIIVGGSPYDAEKAGTASIYSVSEACAGLPYGKEVNPPGSLIHFSGSPAIGSTVSFAVDNPYGTQAPGSIPLLFISAAPHPAFPWGNVVDSAGMAGPGAPCEILISSFQLVLYGSPWSGTGMPAPVDIAIPVNPDLVGKSFYTQGLLVDPIAASGVPFGCTTAVQVTITE